MCFFKKNKMYVVIYGSSYLCNFRDWDRTKLLDNTLETRGGFGGLERGYTVSLRRDNAALFSSVSDAEKAIRKFNLDARRCRVVELSKAPFEL